MYELLVNKKPIQTLLKKLINKITKRSYYIAENYQFA